MTVKRRRVGKTGHGYTVDGEKVPGVTRILDLLPKDALIKWAAESTGKYAINNWESLSALPPADRLDLLFGARFEKSDPAAKRGTQVHRLAEPAIRGEAINMDAVPVELRGYVEAYLDFCDTIDPKPLQNGTELVVANRTHRYCGTADLVADLPALAYDGEVIPACRWLLDLKTSPKSVVWPESALQACAYENAEVFVDPDEPDDERKVEWLQIERCGVVHIGPTDWALHPLDTGPEVWEFFLHLRWLYDHMEMKNSKPVLPGYWVGGTASVAEPALA
jgi:hypothetical protein